MIGRIHKFTLAAAVSLPSLLVAAETDTVLSGTKFVTATTIAFENVSNRFDAHEAFVWIYRSRLGTALNRRELKASELAELQRLCDEMHRFALQQGGGAFDSYGIEFVNGRGDFRTVRPNRRAVFFFDDGGKCNSQPLKAEIE